MEAENTSSYKSINISTVYKKISFETMTVWSYRSVISSVMKTSQEEIKFPSVSVLSEPLSGYFRCQFLLKKWIKKLIFSKSF